MNMILYILICVKYTLKCGSTQRSDINVSLALCQILRVVSTSPKCHYNCQSKMRGFICHAISLHPLSMRNMYRQRICENINMKTDIALSSCRCVEKQSRNVHFTCLTIAEK